MYFLLSHAAEYGDEGSRPAIAGAKGLNVYMLDIPPGGRVPLHVHLRSHEAFLCLKGRVKFRWNDHGEDEAILEPLDMIDVPVGLYRNFQCVGEERALLLCIISDEREDEPGDVVIAPEESARLVERHGHAVLERLTAATGVRFTHPARE
jgi:uncharacterized RmlC-like cupin family protein